MSKFREQLETWLHTIDVKAERVLDLGGASNPVRTRVKSWKVEECTFFDIGIEKAVVEYIPFDINLSLDSQFRGYRLEDIEKSLRFDVIFCLELFEYIWNPVQAMKNIYDLLQHDGIAYVSFCSIYPVHNPVEIDYMRLTKRAIEKYCEIVGFEIKEIVSRKATRGRLGLGGFYIEEGMHPVRKSELPFDLGYMCKFYKS